jgi:antitoxin component YwqK of YwqJK toxin-antitoxin module
MKKCVILVAMMFSGILVAQEVKPELEAVGNKVKATYYFENGKVQQEGFFKDGKLDGVWVSYDEKGNKVAVGEYTDGLKTGKWIFFNENSLCEVAYENSKISSIKNLQKNALANTN